MGLHASTVESLHASVILPAEAPLDNSSQPERFEAIASGRCASPREHPCETAVHGQAAMPGELMSEGGLPGRGVTQDAHAPQSERSEVECSIPSALTSSNPRCVPTEPQLHAMPAEVDSPIRWPSCQSEQHSRSRAPLRRPSPPSMPPPVARLADVPTATVSAKSSTAPPVAVQSRTTQPLRCPRPQPRELPAHLAYATDVQQKHEPKPRAASCPPNRSRVVDSPREPAPPATKRPPRTSASPRALQMQAALARARQPCPEKGLRAPLSKSHTQHVGAVCEQDDRVKPAQDGDVKCDQVKCAARSYSAEPAPRKPPTGKPRHRRCGGSSLSVESAQQALSNSEERGSLAWAFRSIRLRRDPRCHLHYGIFQKRCEDLDQPLVTETNLCEEHPRT